MKRFEVGARVVEPTYGLGSVVAVEDAYTGAASWTGFVFGALADAARDCGLRSSAARHLTPASPDEAWLPRSPAAD